MRLEYQVAHPRGWLRGGESEVLTAAHTVGGGGGTAVPTL